MSKVDSEPYVIAVIEEYMKEMEFEEFLYDTANKIISLEEEIVNLKKEIKELKNG